MWTLARLHLPAVCLSVPNTSTSWPFQFTMSIMREHTPTHTAPSLIHVQVKVGVNHPCVDYQMSQRFDIHFADSLKRKEGFAYLSVQPLFSFNDKLISTPRCSHYIRLFRFLRAQTLFKHYLLPYLKRCGNEWKCANETDKTNIQPEK